MIAAALLALLLLPAGAVPDPILDDKKVDGSHGRFEGDLAVVVGAGATIGPRAPRGTLDVRLRYLSSAGVFATYEDGFGGSVPRRALALGLEVRPLFLARWGTNHEIGTRPRVDLIIDSIALEVGALFSEPAGTKFLGRRGLQAGIGVAFLFFDRGTGPFVAMHGGCRWSDNALGGGPIEGPGDRALFLTLEVSWQQLFGGHIVDLGDRRQDP